MGAAVGRQQDRVVPAEFAEQFARVFPRVPGMSWVDVRWEAGDTWAPINRWAVWECVPWPLMRDIDVVALRPALDGPNPRATGHYCAAGACECAIKKNGWTGGASVGVDYHRQWVVSRSVGAFARVIWIVQGENGGHPRGLDSIEQQLAKAAGLPADMPVGGALPYAPLDQRVIDALCRRDRLRDAKGVLGAVYAAPGALLAEERERASIAASRVFDYIMDQTSAPAEEAAWALKRHVGNTIVGMHGDKVSLLDAAIERQTFIDEMAVVGPRT